MINYKEGTRESIKFHNTYIDYIKDIKINVVKSTPKSFGKTLQNRGKMNKSRVR